MFFGKMGFSGCSSLLLMISVNSFFVPVGDESAWMWWGVPCVLGLLLL